MIFYQMTVKRIIAVILATVILVMMPIDGIGKVRSYAAESAVSYSKSTLASMFLASMGMSYVLVNTAASNLRDYLEEKISEFEVIDGGKLPGGNDNNDWKSTIGGILFGAGAVDIYNRFISFLKGDQEDNTVQQVVNVTGSQVTINGYTYDYLDVDWVANNYIGTLEYDLNYDAFKSLLDYDYFFANEQSYYFGDPNNHVAEYIRSYPSNSFVYLVTKSTGTGSNHVYVYDASIENKITRIGLVCTKNGYSCSLYLYDSNLKQYALNNPNKIYDGIIEPEGSSVNIYQKLEDMQEVSVPSGDGVIIEQPAGVETYNLNPYNVPVAVPDADLWEQIAAMIEENTQQDVVYNPTYQIYEDYDSAHNIASGSYDTPAGPEDLPAEEVSPGVVGEVVDDLWTMFKGAFPWDKLKVKFPFSVPYDIYLIAKGLTGYEYNVLEGLPSTPSKAKRFLKSGSGSPVYDLEMPLPGGKIWDLTLDFGEVEPLLPVIRAGTGILFLACLFGGL